MRKSHLANRDLDYFTTFVKVAPHKHVGVLEGTWAFTASSIYCVMSFTEESVVKALGIWLEGCVFKPWYYLDCNVGPLSRFLTPSVPEVWHRGCESIFLTWWNIWRKEFYYTLSSFSWKLDKAGILRANTLLKVLPRPHLWFASSAGDRLLWHRRPQWSSINF